MQRASLPAALLAAALAGCIPPPDPPADPWAALGERRGPWLAAGEGGQAALALGRWTEAAALFEKRVTLAAGVGGAVAEETRLDLYNLACARSLAGLTEAALDALEGAFREGPGPMGFDLLAEDPDLVPLRGEARWKALLRDLSWNEDVELLEAGQAVAIVVAIGEGAAGPSVPGALVAVPAPPYRAEGGRRAWRTRLDTGEKAGEKAVFALREAQKRALTHPTQRILRASGRDGVRLAWEVLLRHPGVFGRAVLDGPAPPRWALLDRGAERMGTEILVASAAGVPDPVVGARVRSCGSVEAAMREALR